MVSHFRFKKDLILYLNSSRAASSGEFKFKEKHKIFIPNLHGGKDIGIPLLKKIIRQIGITEDDFIKL